MDNGHSNAIFSGNPEAGHPEVNNPEVDDNLNAENWQESLKEAVPAGMPTPEQLANTEIASTEDAGLFSAENPQAPTNSDSQPLKNPEKPQELGQIIPASPMTPPPAKSSAEAAANSINQTLPSVKIVDGRLNDTAKVDQALTELSQTEDLNNFYEEVRGQSNPNSFMDETLSSFNRVIGQDQAGGAA